MLGAFHLNVLYDIFKDIHFIYDTDRIHAFLLEKLLPTLDADAASLFISDERRENLKLKACIGAKKQVLEMLAEELPFPVGKGLCGWVAKFNQPVLVEDVSKDERFNRQVDTLTGYKTKSVLCVPLSNRDDVLGVIELLNKKNSVFNKNDLELTSLIAKQTAIALENARLVRELEARKDFDEAVLAHLPGGFISTDPAGAITHLNTAAERILGLSAAQLQGRPATQALSAYPALVAPLAKALSAKESCVRQTAACIRPDGTSFEAGFSAFPILNKSQGILGAGLNFQDISQFAK